MLRLRLVYGWLRERCTRRTVTGQAMIEYVVLAAMLVVTASIMALFMYAFRENSGRVLALTASEFP